MASLNQYVTANEHIEKVKALIALITPEMRMTEEFHDILRDFQPIYFDEWVEGQPYVQTNVIVWFGMKYLVIKDIPDGNTTPPNIVNMREYCLPYQGMWRNLWAFKEPVPAGALRYPYQSEDTYSAKRTLTSAENVAPPNEALDLWELVPPSEVMDMI